MTPHQHIATAKAIITRASLREQGCGPATIEALMIAAANPDTGAEVIKLNLDYARTVADKAALLGALALLRNQGSMEVAA